MPAGTGLGQSTAGGMSPSELARLEYLEDNEYKVTYWASVSTDSGAVTKPTGSTIILDGFMSGVDALVETIVNGQPSGLSPVTAGGAYVTVSSFDAAGNYTLSGTPSATPVALLYIVTIPGDQYQNLDNTKVVTAEPTGLKFGTPPIASYIVETDSNKNLVSVAKNTAYNLNLGTTAGTVLEGNRITQVITNGVTDKAPSEDAVFDALAGKSSVIAKQTTDSSHSGNTANTIITNISIPANSMGANDIGFIEAMFYKTGSTDTATWTIYIGPTSNSLVGATSLGNASNTATQLFASMHRSVVNKNSQNTNYAYQQAGGVENPWANATSARVAMNQDFSTQLYLMVAVQMNGTTDTGGVDWIYMTKQ